MLNTSSNPSNLRYSGLWMMLLSLFFHCNLPVSYAETGLSGMVLKYNVVTAPYEIAPGDVLSFGVNEEPDFEQTNIIVRRDGYATIRPLGEIYVANMDIQALTNSLESRLGSYLNSPKVFLNIQQFHVPKIYIFGAVMHPGMYQPTKKMAPGSDKNMGEISIMGNDNPKLTISSVLINSGGVDYDANLSKVLVIKQNGKKLTINLLDLMLHNDVTQDVLLEDGDIVQVSRVGSYAYGDAEFLLLSSAGIYPQQFPVRVLGEVERPGMFYISADTPYLNTALALASGYKMNAIRQAVIISRRNTNNQMFSIVVNPKALDLVLRPNDVIAVKDKASAKTVRGLESFSRIIQPLVWGLRK